MKELILKQLNEAADILERFKGNEDNLKAISKAADLIISSIKNDGKVISCGNGGSACDAMHFAEEMTGRFRDNRDPLPAIAISDPSHITCAGNDFGFTTIFSRYIRAIGKKGDILLALSTSGNSENILRAAEIAKQKQMKIIALTGHNGGKLAEFADVNINVPHMEYSDRIQEMHIKIIHTLIMLIEEGVAQ